MGEYFRFPISTSDTGNCQSHLFMSHLYGDAWIVILSNGLTMADLTLQLLTQEPPQDVLCTLTHVPGDPVYSRQKIFSFCARVLPRVDPSSSLDGSSLTASTMASSLRH